MSLPTYPIICDMCDKPCAYSDNQITIKEEIMCKDCLKTEIEFNKMAARE